jgi:hypothetical protein
VRAPSLRPGPPPRNGVEPSPSCSGSLAHHAIRRNLTRPGVDWWLRGPLKLGRNDPCRCGSGRKYKRCCLASDEEAERAKAADARAEELADERRELAEEERLLDEERKIRQARRPSLEEYQAKLALLRSTAPTDRMQFLEDLLEDSAKDFDPDEFLEVFADELAEKTSDEELKRTLHDPHPYWYEQIEAVERAGLTDEADLLRALVSAAEYPTTRQERQSSKRGHSGN